MTNDINEFKSGITKSTGEVDMALGEQIKELAYSIWEREGCPEGKDAEHYYRAKKILEEQEAASSAANKSVPPASTIKPPSAPQPVERPTVKRHSKKA